VDTYIAIRSHICFCLNMYKYIFAYAHAPMNVCVSVCEYVNVFCSLFN